MGNTYSKVIREDEKSEENEEINDEAPPLAFSFHQINKNENVILDKKNINNINLNDDKENNNINLNDNKKNNIFNKNALNINNSLDNAINFQFPYYYNSLLLKYQQYPNFGMIYPNSFNQLPNNNINNINNVFFPYNNIGNFINMNKNEYNSNLYDLKIDINSETLNKLNNNDLIDIILFINNSCQIKIDHKNLGFKHKIFKIKKDKSKNNKHLFAIKKNILSNLLNNIDNIDNNSESDDEEIDEKENIKNKENNINNINNINLPNEKININSCNSFYCNVHHKIYTNIDYYTHCKEHKKCKICGAEFEKKKLLKIHMKIQHSRKLNNNQNSNSNAKKSEKKVKCSDCDLFFNSVESMSSHYYEIHEKNKLKNNINLKENSISINEKKNINQSKEDHENLFQKNKETFDEIKQGKEQLRNHEEEKRKYEELKVKEELKRQEELRIKEELRQKEELKKIEELKKQKEEKQQENIEKIKEEKKLQLLEEQEQNTNVQNINKNEYYYECYHDSITFETEQQYINHFRKFHPNDFPFYCDICNKGFYSYKAINEHNRAKGHII